jgi:uncharacterized lipoprotein YddW (UPF0748 family)
MDRWSLALVGCLLFGACRSGPDPARSLERAIWVDRWDWRTAQDIERAMDDCRNLGFTAVMFQVRGNGTVHWRSQREVFSERFAFKDPGFDPLRVAIEAAHSRGMQLHAWVNVMPGWVGVEPPGDPRQLWASRPEWFLMDKNGDRQRPGPGRYLNLNPALPEVRRYLAGLCREIAEFYPVDGVHLDYVRFPDPEPDGPLLGADPRTLALFTGATGARSTDVERLRGWQIECITQTVAEISQEVRSVQGRRVLLTAAVWADQAQARDKVRQDWASWCRRRLVDAVFPMNYTGDDATFAGLARADVEAAAGVPVLMGVGLYRLGDAEQCVRQFDAALQAGARGVAVFNYRSLFGARAGGTGGAVGAAAGGPDPSELRRRIGTWLLTRGSR